jgi:hypothetical protein
VSSPGGGLVRTLRTSWAVLAEPSRPPHGIGRTAQHRRRSGLQTPCPGGEASRRARSIHRVQNEGIVGQERAGYSTYAKDNFCFERVISGWRGALTVLDLRLKK